jgi:fructosamine-3-kinase
VTLPAGCREARRVGGGDINEGWRAVLADGTVAFVKTRPGAVVGEYALEAWGLQWLGEAGALRVPRVLAVDDAYLALEWIDSGVLDERGEEELGSGLAALHGAGADEFGGPRPLRIGPLELPNEPAPTWAQFYAERRLVPLAGRVGLSKALEPVCGRIGEVGGPAEPPARLHGDLWGGNVLAGADGRPWLIDPAAYGGHREIDLAMLRLFGGASERVFAAYEEVSPLAEGWRERVELWQLFPLLVHAVLFGGAYVESVRRVARRYG